MTDDLRFEHPFDLNGALLPYNYFPAAFGLLADASNPMNRVVLVLPGDEDGRRAAVTYHIVAADTLKDPEQLAKYLDARGIGDGFASRRCFLGPPTGLEQTAIDQVMRLDFEPLEVASETAISQVAVIIDIGIAYWNPAFTTKQVPRFKAMRYLDFDAFTRGKPALESLPYATIKNHCTKANQPGGHDKIVAELGQQFPDSYFGPNGGAEPGTLWHGTAMADLMAGLPQDAPDSTVLMGIELPMAVLRDADGDSLGSVLATLLEGALEMTATQFSAVPLVIALPWGFTGGLQDGSHPFALAIDKVLALHPDRDVKLLVPMGNQMQDRCCGHILPTVAAEPENAVTWRLPPDDFSENSAEFNVISGIQSVYQTVRITAPTGATPVILLKEAQGVLITLGGIIIGALLRYRDTATGPRLRLTLAPTGWQETTAQPCLAGDWVLSFHHKDDVRIWVLRDDRDWALDKALPRRASLLYDPNYHAQDQHDAYLLTDDPNSAVVRSGTASILASARAVTAVQANETLGAEPPQPAWYSGRRTSLKAAEAVATVDQGRHNAGVLAAANGTGQMVRVSGTSAAIALAARGLLGLPARPTY